MKTLNWIYFIALIVIAGSCQKVIDVDLNSEDPKYVVEGEILIGDTTHHVRIARSLNFDQDEAYPTVDNAVVSVIDNLGNAATFTFVGNGIYELNGYTGVSGRTYTLTVTVDGEAFVASSTMPGMVPMDLLYVEEFVFGQDTFRTVVPARYDPVGVPNYYQFKVTRNGEVKDGIYLETDQFTDGNYDVDPLFVGDLFHGDTLKVDMYGLDKPVWSYFNQLYVNTSSSATPANPTSNFSGGCLGYFTARTVSSKTIVYQ